MSGSLRDAQVPVKACQPLLQDALLNQLEAAADAGQQIVEIMRDAAGQLAHRLHFLRLDERSLYALQFRSRGDLCRDVAAYRVEEVAARRGVGNR